jgi:hypothetical protein
LGNALPNPRHRPHPPHDAIDFIDVAIDAAWVRGFAGGDQGLGGSDGSLHAGKVRFHLGLGGAQFR